MSQPELLATSPPLNVASPQNKAELIEQLSSLCSSISGIVAVDQDIRYLNRLRRPTRQSRSKSDRDRNIDLCPIQDQAYFLKLEEDLRNLAVEIRESPDLKPELWRRYCEIKSEIEKRIDTLDFLFNSSIYPIRIRSALVQNIGSKIVNPQRRKDVDIQIAAIGQLEDQLNNEQLLRLSVRDRSSEMQASLGAMIAIEERRRFVEQILRADAREQYYISFWICLFVIFYCAIAVFIPVLLYLFPDNPLINWLPIGRLNARVPMNDSALPLIGIPWPVLLWSWIGSVAATIYNFNRKSIATIGEAIRWMITRPTQGVVLGSAFYLVLNSGLLLLGASSETSSSRNEVTLVLCFLVGFSDRFVDQVFNTLVDQYSGNKAHKPKPSEQYQSEQYQVEVDHYDRRQISYSQAKTVSNPPPLESTNGSTPLPPEAAMDKLDAKKN